MKTLPVIKNISPSYLWLGQDCHQVYLNIYRKNWPLVKDVIRIVGMTSVVYVFSRRREFMVLVTGSK